MVLLKVTNVNSLKTVSTEAGCEKIQGMQQFIAEVYFRLKDCKDKEEKLPHTCMCAYLLHPPNSSRINVEGGRNNQTAGKDSKSFYDR